MMSDDVLDDTKHAHASSSENTDNPVKTVSNIGTDEDRLAVINLWNLKECVLILLQGFLTLLVASVALPYLCTCKREAPCKWSSTI